jgi:hypothetical protein
VGATGIEEEEVGLVFERNNAGLKKLSSFVWTDKWFTSFMKAMGLLKYWTVNGIFHISIRIIRHRD